MKISIIAVIGRNRELGKDNKLLWNIPEDLKRFKKLTQGHAVIMGRKTFESLGKPLLNRANIIITRDKNYKQKHFNYLNNQSVIICFSLEEAIGEGKKFESSFVKVPEDREVFIIGGGEIYRQALSIADKLYLTLVDADCPEADTYFPDYSKFRKIIFKESHQEDRYKYTFLELEKSSC